MDRIKLASLIVGAWLVATSSAFAVSLPKFPAAQDTLYSNEQQSLFDETAFVQMAQNGPVTSMMPRPRPAGLSSENNALVEAAPVQAPANTNAESIALLDENGIIRPRARPVIATSPIDTSPTDAELAEEDDIVEDEDILRPRARPEGITQQALVAAETESRLAMQNENNSTPSTAVVTGNAVSRRGLDMNRISLIGVYGTEQSRRAMLRMASGDLIRVARGGEADGWRVVAIASDSVRIQRGTEILLLETP